MVVGKEHPEQSEQNTFYFILPEPQETLLKNYEVFLILIILICLTLMVRPLKNWCVVPKD